MKKLYTHFLTTTLSKWYTTYLKLIVQTSHIHIDTQLSSTDFDGKMIGFWHSDSYTMNLLLAKLRHCLSPHVVITSNRRGDYIEEVLGNHGGTALRIPDGAGIRKFLSGLITTAKCPDTTVCIALDGPSGPYRQPKKLLFSLGQQANKSCIVVDVHYSHVLRVPLRWDKYAIPLPFSKITFQLQDVGIPSSEELRNFHDYSKSLK